MLVWNTNANGLISLFHRSQPFNFACGGCVGDEDDDNDCDGKFFISRKMSRDKPIWQLKHFMCEHVVVTGDWSVCECLCAPG